MYRILRVHRIIRDAKVKSRFSQSEIIEKLQQAEAKLAAGGTVDDVCKEFGISVPTFYGWRKKYGEGQGTGDQGKRLKELEEENGILRNLVADQAIEIARLKGS